CLYLNNHYLTSKPLVLFLFLVLRAEPGDRVEVNEPIAQVETDKVLTLSSSSYLRKEILWNLTQRLLSYRNLVKLYVAPSDKATPSPLSPAEEEEEKPKPKVETTPVVQKPKESSLPSKSFATEPQLPPKERERRVPMTRLRKRVATPLKDSQNTFALLTTFNEVDMSTSQAGFLA
ncbi:dihydrolipoyllysine-residue succinyltransferase component of 2-oxoglutarate dehydrogenase complex 1, mitochondrial-like, partial [Olea europaea var. sylvestris]|uniref:dihydrolipoyllysine-residue succinyltransferase component of 2-oxoglutarate dehydrogenase complex 1, mitochondrial-like n=1 Tax=Olea europaea var. sylvestris TaxID=158386 RepID=UPI000C1D6960